MELFTKIAAVIILGMFPLAVTMALSIWLISTSPISLEVAGIIAINIIGLISGAKLGSRVSV